MVSDQIKGAVVGFIVLLSKGLLEDDRWDWDVEKCDWEIYQRAFLEPTILKTTMAVFMNSLNGNKCENYEDARYRGFQYFRMIIESKYKPETPFTQDEIKEPDWRVWEA